jgi:hypothetical protein
MQNSFDLALWLAIWMAAVTVILYRGWKSSSPGVGLGLAYRLHLWLIHWVAASIYLLPWYQNYDVGLVEMGFQQSAYGVLAFAVGSLVLTPIVLSFRRFPTSLFMAYESHPNLPKAYMLIGGVSYLLLSSTLGHVPTANALVAVGQQLFVVGLCLSCWKAWQEKDLRRFIGWSVAALLMPLITIISRGFIGYGAVATFIVLTFIASFYRPRWQVIVAGLLLGYLGLSFYGSYMRDRSEIRGVVWGGNLGGIAWNRFTKPSARSNGLLPLMSANYGASMNG